MAFIKSHDNEYLYYDVFEKDVVAKVRVGASNRSDNFIPNANISLWDDEVWINLNPEFCKIELNDSKAKSDFVDGEASIRYGTSKIRVWRLNETVIEYAVVFAEIPNITQLEFVLTHSDGIEFFQQPALTDDEIKNGAIRPDNVVGSLAVYSKKSGGKYRTGKICHLYRWQAIDAGGNTAWCDDLQKIGDKLIIGLPTKFLSSAKYPVTLMGAGDTIGIQTAGASEESLEGVICAAVDTPSASGTASKISVYCRETEGEIIHYMLCAIYTDSDDALLAQSSSLKQVSTVGWYDWAITASISSGVAYALSAFCGGGGGAINIYYDSATGEGRKDVTTGTTYPTLPDPVTWTSDPASRRYSIHLDFTASGASAVPKIMLLQDHFSGGVH